MSNALELHKVVKFYGRRQALAGLDLQVPAGSIFGLIGSNGAGLSTPQNIPAESPYYHRTHACPFIHKWKIS